MNTQDYIVHLNKAMNEILRSKATSLRGLITGQYVRNEPNGTFVAVYKLGLETSDSSLLQTTLGQNYEVQINCKLKLADRTLPKRFQLLNIFRSTEERRIPTYIYVFINFELLPSQVSLEK